MRKITDTIFQWSVFSTEKQLDFNGLWIMLSGPQGDTPVLIDPPPMTDDVQQTIVELGAPKLILLTNKDHRRHAPEAREHFGAEIWIHERDRSLTDCEVDHTFSDGQIIAGCFEVVPVSDAKSPGESALYWRERQLLVLGDALISKQSGTLSLLPDKKFSDPMLARKGASALAELKVDMLLLGDGHSFIEGGGDAIRKFVDAAE